MYFKGLPGAMEMATENPNLNPNPNPNPNLATEAAMNLRR